MYLHGVEHTSEEYNHLRFVKTFLSLLLELWPVLIAGLLFLLAKSQEWAFLFPEKGKLIDYWFMVRSRSLIFGLAACILPMAMIAISIWFFARPSKTKSRYYNPLISFLLSVVGVGLLIYATGLMCLQSFSLLYKDFGHFQNATIDYRVYYVDSIWREATHGDTLSEFVLFECDKDGKLCQGIFQKTYQLNSEAYKKMSAALIPDPAAHTITLQINGEAVYVHPAK